ncbi:DUF4867 family protein [Anaerotruncus massiliensis (ex Liu et al. 2021)]|uniref:DUF4867 family protein n=2 Tax=Anaerotruncus TaxID=244127 RepID=A0A498CR34_9FIRM|nr:MULTISPECIES: DUF4867 family protein [Anaerotruncus]MBC3937627.1 DUF4867 family protein [Anaerotruncus massiliensis (ex Togo et al. 2019)]RLL14735.1 DUF4867 family protein [Anaerotruncus massiliensis (ex Liu et al. 2021)]
MIQSIRPVGSDAFGPYGRVVAGYRFDGLLQVLREHTPRPSDGTVYVASDPRLERLPVFGEVQAGFFGGLPAQFGYCNGVNTRLACCEYHQCSELLVAADDLVLVVGPRGGISGGVCNTARFEAFSVPAGTAVELYGTTLHYAPCSARTGEGFRALIALLRFTNFPLAAGGDPSLAAVNKWVLAHPDSPEAKQGAHIGLSGEIVDIAPLIA